MANVKEILQAKGSSKETSNNTNLNQFMLVGHKIRTDGTYTHYSTQVNKALQDRKHEYYECTINQLKRKRLNIEYIKKIRFAFLNVLLGEGSNHQT